MDDFELDAKKSIIFHGAVVSFSLLPDLTATNYHLSFSVLEPRSTKASLNKSSRIEVYAKTLTEVFILCTWLT
jgi:hypothetical protein